MKRVFISYAREDGDFVDILRQKLTEANIPTWQDEDLRGGQDWRAEIDLAIRDAPAVVVVMSPEASRSAWVGYEWAFALGVGVNVIPVLLKIGPDDLHPALRRREWVDLSNRLARRWELLERAILGTRQGERTTTVRVPPDAPPAIEQAARALDSLDEKEREAAIATLGKMKHPTVVEVLASAVHHPTQDVRIGAALLLSVYGDKRALPGLIEGCKTGWDPEVSGEHFARLGKDAAPELIACLQDPDERVRRRAACALGEIRDPAAISGLKQMACDSSDPGAYYAVIALGKFQDPALLPVFEQAFRNGGTQRSALCAAAELPNAAGEKVLLEALTDPDSNVRSAAAEGLKEAASPAAIPALAAALRDSSSSVRRAAVEALERLNDAATTPLLLEALDDEYDGVCRRASDALAKAGGPAVVSGLIAVLRDQRSLSREGALETLAKIGGESAVAGLIEALGDEELRESAVRALGKFASPGAAASSALINSLQHEGDSEMRKSIIYALADGADPAAVEPLARLLRDPQQDVVNAAEHALGRINAPEAWAALKDWRLEKRRAASQRG